MRISDWSSDVCSSDLPRITSGGFDRLPLPPPQPGRIEAAEPRPLRTLKRKVSQGVGHLAHEVRYVRSLAYVALNSSRSRWSKIGGGIILARSEEHTSEPQSLMRNSDAVLRVKKKNT